MAAIEPTMSGELPTHHEELLPNIGELPPAIQQTLRKFARIAKSATEERDSANRRLQGLENLSHILQEYQTENVRNQDQFKWYEIVLLRTEADLLRTKKRLQTKELENERMRQKFEKLRAKGQLPKEDEDVLMVRDQSDGKSKEQETEPAVADESDQKPPQSNGSLRASRPRRQTLAPTFLGISEDIHNKTLRELEETRKQLKERIEQDNTTYKEYLDAKKSELQIRKLLETVAKLRLDNEEKAKALSEIKMIDKDKIIFDLKEENEKHREGDAMKVKVIEASNRRCQELKEEIEELSVKYKQQKENQEMTDKLRRKVADPYQKDLSLESTALSVQKLLSEKQSLLKVVENLKNREERLMLDNIRTRSENEHLRREYNTLQDSLETEVQYGDEASPPPGGCRRCNKFTEEIRRIREVTLILESEKSATVAQMKLFEDDFHKVREQLKFNEEKHQKEMSDSMKNCQMLSQSLDKTKEDMQKTCDHNQALEYQLSIVRECRPYYSVDSHPVARSGTGPVYNPRASPWQEGYRSPRALTTLDFADSRQEIEADSAYQELKGEESEEEAELTRR